MGTIPETFHDLFERRSFAHFATLMPAGTPQVTPVWIDHERVDGADRLLVNTERGRQKERNVRRNPKVGVSILDPEDPYRFLSARGEVVEVTAEGARDHADALAGRYMGLDEYPSYEEEEGERVVLRIDPRRVATGGGATDGE